MAGVLQSITPGGLVRYGTGERKTAEGSMRTTKMYAEAEDFSRRMLEFERGLHTFQHATTDFLDTLLPMMTAPLPRVWDHLPDGALAEPLRARVTHGYPSEVLGADVDVNGIRAAVLEMERRMVTGISRPLLQWREALDTAKQRLPEVERLRRELAREQGGLDRTVSAAERRHRRDVGLDEPTGVAGLLFRCTHPRSGSPTGRLRGQRGTGGQVAAADAAEAAEAEAAGGAGGGGGAGRDFREEFRNEDRNMKTVYRARRREAVLKSFTEQEGLLNEQLSGLCRDASWLKSYMVAALVASKEGMQSVTHFLGSTKQPVPGHSDEVPAAVRGTVSDNDTFIRGVPKYLFDRTSRTQALERIRGRMGKEGLHAHRAVASPMELHARGDISGREYVEPVRRGAADRPLGAATESLLGGVGVGGVGSEASAAAPAGVSDILGGGAVGGGALGGGLPEMPAAEKLTVVGRTVLPVASGGVEV